IQNKAMQSVERFSGRVENYARYRPGYPTAIIDLLKGECGLTAESVIADIGSGTGKLSDIFLANGNVVIGVEPNASMRAAAESILAPWEKFRSVDGTAESTTLDDASVDFVLAGQAFHWFDIKKTKSEFKRILKPNGWVVIVWNERQTDTTPFLCAYEQLLLTYGTDYQDVRHENAEPTVRELFAPRNLRFAQFPNHQQFNFEALRGRLLSSSYTPEPSSPAFEPMLTELESIFNEYQERGVVRFQYDTRVFYERLD
ncbi:MAG TPA: class I SAM-dependent methyltransferase, partial [Pyrinomonadaceae bacterium]